MTEKDNLTKAHYRVLEKIFAGEIAAALEHHGMPVQLRSKYLPELESLGLIKQTEVKLGRRFPVTVKGWNLTLAGNMTYCLSCDDDGEA